MYIVTGTKTVDYDVAVADMMPMAGPGNEEEAFDEDDGGGDTAARIPSETKPKVRTEFPETWLWADKKMGYKLLLCSSN